MLQVLARQVRTVVPLMIWMTADMMTSVMMQVCIMKYVYTHCSACFCTSAGHAERANKRPKLLRAVDCFTISCYTNVS